MFSRAVGVPASISYARLSAGAHIYCVSDLYALIKYESIDSSIEIAWNMHEFSQTASNEHSLVHLRVRKKIFRAHFTNLAVWVTADMIITKGYPDEDLFQEAIPFFLQNALNHATAHLEIAMTLILYLINVFSSLEFCQVKFLSFVYLLNAFILSVVSIFIVY